MNTTRTALKAIMIISIFLNPGISTAKNTWEKLWMPVKSVVLGYESIESVNLKYAVVPNTGDIYRYTGVPFSWDKVGGPGKAFVIAEGRLYGLSPNGSAVYQLESGTGKWKKVGGAAKQIYGGDGGLYAISPSDRHIYSYDVITKKWSEIGGPAESFAVGGKGELYGISPNGSDTYQYMGQPNKWQRIGGSSTDIYAAPGYLYRTDEKGDIYKYTGNPLSWIKIGGPGYMFTATSEGDLYGISPDRQGIYRYLGSPGKWERIGDEAVAIYSNKDELLAIRNDKSLWAYMRPTLPTKAEMVIITKDLSLSKAVEDYVAYQQLQGRSTAVVTLDEILQNNSGVDVAEKIRNFLVSTYKSGLLQYVMLVGDVDTIPTKIFFRDNGHVAGNRAIQNAYSTDFYYANLDTQDWDLDNDDLWGEINDDKLDIRNNIILSRIPFNDHAIVSKVMQQFIDFHEKSGEQWQRKVILAHGFMSKSDDLAGYAEKIDKNILQPNGFTSSKLYVDTKTSNAGKTKSVYSSAQTKPLGNGSYMGELTKEGQGLTLAAAHGTTTSMVSIYEKLDGTEGDIAFGDWGSVKNHPLSGIFFLNGCNTAPTLTPNGYPATDSLDSQLDKQGSRWSSINMPTHGNIAKEYLKSGAVAVIASTVGSDTGSQEFEYEFAKQLVESGQTIGLSFVKGKEKAGSSRAIQTFYLVGDPTIRLK